MQLYENKSNSAMESGDHFKNGASLKSRMSREILCQATVKKIVILLLLVFSCAGTGFGQELVREYKGNLSGLVNKEGTFVVPPEFNYISDFIDGVAIAKKWKRDDNTSNSTISFIINSDGTVIPVPDKYYVFEYMDGLFRIRNKETGKYGFIDKRGKEVIPVKYGVASDFYKGYAVADGTIINKKGETIVTLAYDDFGRYFDEGLLPVGLDGKWGFVNNTGDMVIPCIYDDLGIINRQFELGYEFVGLNGKGILIDKTGKQIKDTLEYDKNTFSEGLVVATSKLAYNKNTWEEYKYRNKKIPLYGYIDKRENVIIPFEYGIARSFREGLAAVCKPGNSGFGFIDKTGKYVIPPKYLKVEDFNDGVCFVSVYQRNSVYFGFIDKAGKEIIPVKYSEQVAKKLLTELRTFENQINIDIEKARKALMEKNYKSAIKILAESAKNTEKLQGFQQTFPEQWETNMVRINNELGWTYYVMGDYSKSVKTYKTANGFKQKDGEAYVGEQLAIYESGGKSQTSMKGDFFIDNYIQGLKSVLQSKKTNIEQKAACLSSFVKIGFDRARRQKDYSGAVEIMNKVASIPGLTDVAWAHYLALTDRDYADFSTFKDIISKVYPKSLDIDFDIDYFDEVQLKIFFTRLDNIPLPSETILKYKFELLDRLPVITSDLCYEYEKAKFDEINTDNASPYQFKNYMERFPNGSFAGEAIKKTAQIDDKLYNAAVNSGEQKQYLKYLSQFPEGRHVAAAKTQTVAMSAAQKSKLIVEQQKADKEETDDINKYIQIEQQDIYFAKGDGLSFMEMIASGSQDLKNWNVFVIAKVKNTGKLPKRVKATVTLKVTREFSVRLLMLSESRTNIYRYTDDWYIDVEPGERNVLVGYFKFQEEARAEGNIFFGDNSHTFIDEKNAFDINFEYYNNDIAASTQKKQTDLIQALRTNGNVSVKEGYASQYREERAKRWESSGSANSDNKSSVSDNKVSSEKDNAASNNTDFDINSIRFLEIKSEGSWVSDGEGLTSKYEKRDIVFKDGSDEYYGTLKKEITDGGKTYYRPDIGDIYTFTNEQDAENCLNVYMKYGFKTFQKYYDAKFK